MRDGSGVILYYARAGNLEGVMAMVKADPTQVSEYEGEGRMIGRKGWIDDR